MSATNNKTGQLILLVILAAFILILITVLIEPWVVPCDQNNLDDWRPYWECNQSK